MAVFSCGQYSKPQFQYDQHLAAVKALAFHPTQSHVLVSGAGTADRCIRSFNLISNELTACVDTGAQVCSLLFSKNSAELCSSHGFPNHHLALWSWPTLQLVGSFTGHTCRALYSSLSPCGQLVVTGAADDTLRFWNMFPPAKQPVTSPLPSPYLPR